jgi:hypothetical protein
MLSYDAEARLHMAREHAEELARDYRRAQPAANPAEQAQARGRRYRRRRRSLQRANA